MVIYRRAGFVLGGGGQAGNGFHAGWPVLSQEDDRKAPSLSALSFSCGHSSIGRAPGFQLGDVGSIPAVRSSLFERQLHLAVSDYQGWASARRSVVRVLIPSGALTLPSHGVYRANR